MQEQNLRKLKVMIEYVAAFVRFLLVRSNRNALRCFVFSWSTQVASQECIQHEQGLV